MSEQRTWAITYDGLAWTVRRRDADGHTYIVAQVRTFEEAMREVYIATGGPVIVELITKGDGY